MKFIIQWLEIIKAKWMNNDVWQEEDFEIFDFDHVPYINEAWLEDLNK